MAQVNLDGIKTQLKSILDAANTTTGSPIDLSAGIETRVAQVMKVHPGRVPIQPNFLPYVTMFYDRKTLEQLTMGTGNQANATRLSVIDLNIVGAVYEPNITDLAEDQGAENCEKLMENIEEILRSNHNINSTVAWSFPREVVYDEIQFSEEASLRAGVLTLQCKVFY